MSTPSSALKFYYHSKQLFSDAPGLSNTLRYKKYVETIFNKPIFHALLQFLQHPYALGTPGFLHINELLAKKVKMSVH